MDENDFNEVSSIEKVTMFDKSRSLVAISGSYYLNDAHYVEQAIQASGFTIDIIATTNRKGFNHYVCAYADRNQIPLITYKVDWKVNQKRAAYMTHSKMALHCPKLIAIWDGRSGTVQDLIIKMLSRGKNVYIHYV